ncbi:hypothetical protein [Symbiopectobacterium sp. RP]|uniref:hypothetical protein n=1 Tax=Symbiopectobacterium sp. RP TaxID=3248553 RepID=UPI003D2C5699
MLHDLNLSIGEIDARLNRRYQRLVKQHMTPAAPLASAVKDLACAQKTTFATTQAVWRFLIMNVLASVSSMNRLFRWLSGRLHLARIHTLPSFTTGLIYSFVPTMGKKNV